MDRSTFFIWLAVILVLLIVLRVLSQPTEVVLLGIDVGLKTSDQQMDFLLTTLDQYGATATFFVPGVYAQEHPEIMARMAERHEIACRTMTVPKMAQLNKTGITKELADCKTTLENITGKTVVGFRAPSNVIDEQTFAALEELDYQYDASIFENFGWFYPQPTVQEIPIGSFMFFPLSDRWLAKRLFLGDLGYFLIKRDKEDVVSIAIDPAIVYDHRGAFQYLLYEYADQDVRFLSHAESLNG